MGRRKLNCQLLGTQTPASKAGSGIKGVMRPTCGEVMARHQAESAMVMNQVALVDWRF